MKEYKVVKLNPGMSLTVDDDIAKTELTINELVQEGWNLEQVIPMTSTGALVGLFSREVYW